MKLTVRELHFKQQLPPASFCLVQLETQTQKCNIQSENSHGIQILDKFSARPGQGQEAKLYVMKNQMSSFRT